MNKQIASMIAIGLFLLAGCAASGPKLLDSAEDMVGTWQSTVASMVLHFNEDGTWGHETPGGDHVHAGSEFRFEGTRLFLKDVSGGVCLLIGAETGIYEVELLENGNLKFTVIEDECAIRVTGITGALIEREWEPVP